MVGNITFGGLGSGLDTGAIIDALLGVERIPIQQLETRKKDEQMRKPDSGIGLVSADYEDGLEGSGFYVRKVVNAPTLPAPMASRSLIFSVDRFLVELVYIGIDGEGAAARELAAKIAAILRS